MRVALALWVRFLVLAVRGGRLRWLEACFRLAVCKIWTPTPDFTNTLVGTRVTPFDSQSVRPRHSNAKVASREGRTAIGRVLPALTVRRRRPAASRRTLRTGTRGVSRRGWGCARWARGLGDNQSRNSTRKRAPRVPASPGRLREMARAGWFAGPATRGFAERREAGAEAAPVPWHTRGVSGDISRLMLFGMAFACRVVLPSGEGHACV